MDNSTTKICFKCRRELLISDFYKHPQMADGHLNKCKECAKADVHDNYLKNLDNPGYVEKERERGRDKYRRLYKGIKHDHSHGGSSARNARAYIERRVGNLPEDVELHHWNYNFPFKVFQLSRRHHARLHKLIVFDEESQCFSYKGKLILTKEEHEALIKTVMPEEHYAYFDF